MPIILLTLFARLSCRPSLKCFRNRGPALRKIVIKALQRLTLLLVLDIRWAYRGINSHGFARCSSALDQPETGRNEAEL